MRWCLALAAAFVVAAPAQAAQRQPSCVKRLAFVHYHVRVAKLPGGRVVACQDKGGARTYELGDAGRFNAAGRYLTFVEAGDNGGERLMRLDIRTGERLQLDRGGPEWDVEYLGALEVGHVAWTSITDGDPRLRVWDDNRRQVLTAVAGTGLDFANFAFSADVSPYWTRDDGTPMRGELDQAWTGYPEYDLPDYRPSNRPRCKQNLVFLRHGVRVVRTSKDELAACGPNGQSFGLGAAGDFVARGTWLVYSVRVAGERDLIELDVRTGERRHLKRPGGFSAFLDALLPDGTVAWTDLDFPGASISRAIRIWPAGAPEPITVEEAIGFPTIDPGSVALAVDGTLYWRDEDHLVRSYRGA
jgi:hypothetical protein